MTVEQNMNRARIISSVAATLIALASGTNYVYSAWAPQFADKLHLSATESELIGLSGNLGMYSLGIPIGMFVDTRGSRPAVLAGSLLLGLGYLPLQRAYDAGQGSVAWLSFASFLTGLGGCMAFAGSVKTSALNWPSHRGTATAFPIAAFGLSAFFFSFVGSVFFPGSPGKFLLLLSIGTFAMTFIGFFFLRVLPHHSPYHVVPANSGMADSRELLRTTSQQSKLSRDSLEPGMSSPEYTGSAATSQLPDPEEPVEGASPDQLIAVKNSGPPTGCAPTEADESCSLLSRSSTTSSLPGEVLVQSSVDMDRSHRVDIRGWKLLKSLEFWQLFTIMGILSGIGLMTINNIGNDASVLWKHYDHSIPDKALVLHQQLHVSILSLGSFSGRLLSGVGSDFLVKGLHASRIWCLVIAAVIFSLAQICALNIINPHLLGFVSGFSGLGYGFLFGVFPSIVAESFGIHGLSQNWGFMTLAPVVSGNIFNLFYGFVLDAHSVFEKDGKRRCEEGIMCYRDAYVVTLSACALGLGVTLWVIWHQGRARLREMGKGHAGE
ncbi:major facilitator superfamily domain-containing protein [Xylaria bambusicola]|uniref:major facilitator superfamily domain-containing protein n=1 Tax=Xylaria bambusicola TaxID=326684 RepID=UPI0020073AB6|nr:major facilitator superfamily domain-containing protein [Xylaria bambusicola]KAI0506216.1 major facilitator superfamily domain-containing protein [Xylaria bambusicola]